MRTTGKRRRLKWILLTPILLVLAVGLWGVMDASGGASARTMWNETWRDGEGTLLGGYLVTPRQARRVVARPATGTPAPAIPSPDGSQPAVLLLHDKWGLNKNMAHLAEQLAADGYVVMVPDLLRGRMAVSLPGAFVQMMMTPQSRVDRDLDTALERLRNIPDVDPDRIALVGFGYGGTQAMLGGMRTERIAATVIFYGRDPVTDPDDTAHLGSRGPVLGVYGGRDRTIAVDRVEAFEKALRESGVETTFRIFPGEGHAFVDSSSIRERGAAGQAWDLLRRFLRENA